jgi:hypothetical protein
MRPPPLLAILEIVTTRLVIQQKLTKILLKNVQISVSYRKMESENPPPHSQHFGKRNIN